MKCIGSINLKFFAYTYKQPNLIYTVVRCTSTSTKQLFPTNTSGRPTCI